MLLSPSQIKTWSPHVDGGCNRKWGWLYLAKLRMPEGGATLRGSMVHKQLELYLKGEPFDTSTPELRRCVEIAIPGIANIPKPLAPGMEVEARFKFNVGDIGYQGVKDVDAEDSLIIPGFEGGVPGFIDHKTTKSTKYIKTVEELLVDEQSNIYAKELIHRFGVPAVDVCFNYLLTEGAPKAIPVRLRMLAPRVAEEFGRIHSIGQEIAVTYNLKPSPLDLEPNVKACDAFGGCPYKSLCTDLKRTPLGALTKEQEKQMTGVDLFAALQAQNNGASVPATYAPINPPEASLPQLPIEVPVTTVVTTAAPLLAITEKPKRTRRTKAEMEAARTAEGPQESVEVVPAHFEPFEYTVEDQVLDALAPIAKLLVKALRGAQ